MSYSKLFPQVLKAGKKLKEMSRLLRGRQSSWEEAKLFVECQLIIQGLLQAYNQDYPLVEARELIPAFDSPLIEYLNLPAFSVLMLNRRLSYMDEGFQYDMLQAEGNPPDSVSCHHNLQIIRSRLPRNIRLNARLARSSLTQLPSYGALLPYLLKMDRGQVLARNRANQFHLAGVFASFPSDLDRQIKRIGANLGKFKKGDNRKYAFNRQFVYRFVMESLGFPICGERHTSAALFALSLLRAGEAFAIAVLGQSDRAITIFSNPLQGGTASLPAISKLALVATSELNSTLQEQGFYLDEKRRALLLKIEYQHHRYHPDNALEGRALSVASQVVIHPKTGVSIEFDVLGLSQENLLMLDSIVHGKFNGSIIYRGQETVKGSKSIPGRLKFLSAWLHKHRFILAEYSMDNIERLNSLLSEFLYDQNNEKIFSRYSNLYVQVHEAWQDLILSHRLRMLEKIIAHSKEQESISSFDQAKIFTILSQILSLEGDELMQRSPADLQRLLKLCNKEMKICNLQIKQGENVDDKTIKELAYLSKVVSKHRRKLNQLLKESAKLASR